MNNNKQTAKRGRPARLSRQQILEAALKLLEKSAAEVTLNGVARTLNVSPMSLYTHIENRDDLLLGVSELVLGKLHLTLNADTWDGNVRLWVGQVQGHFARYPQIVKLLGEGQQLSVEWIRLEAQLVALLEPSGLSDAERVYTANLLSQALIFDCIMGAGNIRDRQSLQVPDLSQLAMDARHGADLLYRHTPTEGHSLLEFVLTQLVQRAKHLIKQQSSSPQCTGE